MTNIAEPGKPSYTCDTCGDRQPVCTADVRFDEGDKMWRVQAIYYEEMVCGYCMNEDIAKIIS